MAKGTQLVTIKNADTGVVLYTATMERDTAVHPLTPEGKTALENGVKAGSFTLTASNGVIIPAGNRPPNTLPAASAVSWMTGLRYTYDNNRLLYIEQAGEAVTLKFETVSGDGLAGSNPDGVPLDSTQFFGFGGNAGKGSFDKQWRFGKSANGSGGIPPVPIKLTFKRNSTGLTTSYTFTPQVGANAVSIPLGAGSGSGNVTTPPVQTVNGTPPTWISARYTWANNRLDVEGAPVGVNGVQVKVARADGGALAIRSGNNQALDGNTFYPSGPLSGQGSFTQEWGFAPTTVSGSGVPAVLIVVTFKHPDGRTYAFQFTPQPGTRQLLFNATSNSSTIPDPVPVSTTYKVFQRGVVLGNSFTSHSASTSIELRWPNNNGMAASSLATDHAHKIESTLKTVNPAFRIMASGNASGFEQQYWKSGDDLPVYSRTTDDIVSYFGQGNKVDLIILSIGENVGESTFNEAKFRVMLDAAIACVPKADQFTVVLRNSVWQGNSSANAVLKQYAADKGYKFANMDEIREVPKNDGSGENYSPYYANEYEGGVRRHYNDAGHADMANRFTDQLKVTVTAPPPVTNPGGGTAPTPLTGAYQYRGDDFNYVELAETSRDDAFPVFESDQMKVTLALPDQHYNSTSPGMGGSVFSIRAKNKLGKELVYNARVWAGEDGGAPRTGPYQKIFTGQGLSDCLYQPPIPYSEPGERNLGPHDASLGYNPNEVGDDTFETGRLQRYGRDGNKFFTAMTPMLYGQQQAPAVDCLFKKWGRVEGRALILNYEANFNRSANYQPVTRGQESPCLYVNNMRIVKWYQGGNPYTNDGITTLPMTISNGGNGLSQFSLNGHRQGGVYPTEPWIFICGDDGYGIGLLLKDNIRSYFGFFGDGGGNDDAPNKGGSYGYIAHAMNEILDMKMRWRHRTEVIVGTVEEVRAYVYANAYRPFTKPSFKFNAAGREGWALNSGDGWATGNVNEQHTWDEVYTGNARNGWKVFFGNSRNAEMASPGVNWKTSEFNKIYVRAAFTGQDQPWQLNFVKNGQKPDGALDTNQSSNKYWMEENTRYPNGTADKNENKVYTQFIGDGQFRVYEFNVGSASGWAGGVVNLIKLRPHATNDKYNYNQGEFAVIDWIDTNPNGPA